MNLIHFWIFSTCLLSSFKGCSCSIILGFEGEAVSLPCRYDSQYHGVCEMCWMRGSIPYQGCGDQIISTNGNDVITGGEARYQLRGEVQRGDVSLTILNARQSDSGKYGCRVHVPGLFNDKKYTIQLVIRKAPTLTPTQQSTTEPTTAADFTTQGDTTSLTSASQCKTTETSAAISTPDEEAALLPTTESTTIHPTTSSYHSNNIRITIIHPTPEPTNLQSPSLQTSAEMESSHQWYFGTTQASVNTEHNIYKSAVDESHDLTRPAIVGSVFVVLGLVGVCLMWKQRRRLRTKLQINKTPASLMNYRDMESGVELMMDGTHGVNGGTEDELQA